MRRSQMRRHSRQARKMRKHGLQPMIFIGSDSELPEVAGALLARSVWRYRSELAPIGVAIATVTTALALHTTHPRWWIGVLVLTAAIGAALLATGQRLGLITTLERAYGAAVVLGTGGWLSAATVLGPFTRPLPHIILIGGTLLSVPWWAHRRRRAKVRVDRKLSAWPEIAQAVGLSGSRVMSAVVDIWGWRARFGLARGQTIHDVINKLPAIESALGTFRGAVRVYPTPEDKANRFELRVLERDPHADSIAWPGPSVSTITEPVELGPFEDAAPARVLLLRRHALIAGIAGSGKSGGVNVVMGNLAACSDVVVWGIDLKRGMELQPWARCIDRLATTPEEARALLRDAVTILEERAAHLAAIGRRVWEPSADMPALVILIDEYAELTDDAPDAATFTDSIARRGRAVAVTLIAATQRPTQKAMGKGAVRSQMDIRISFRVRERKDVDLILGQGMLNAGWHAHTLNAPGKFLISAPEHDAPRRARAYLLGDQTVASTAHRYAIGRPALDSISRGALERREEPRRPATPERGGIVPSPRTPADEDPEALLWATLSAADEALSVGDLMTATGMGRSWVYYRLQDLAGRGRVTRTDRGRWQAVSEPEEQ